MLEETRCISSPPLPQVQVVSQTLHWDSTVKRTVWVGGSGTSDAQGNPPTAQVTCTTESVPVTPGFPGPESTGESPSERSGTRKAGRKRVPALRRAPKSGPHRALYGVAGSGPGPRSRPSRWVETPDFHPLSALGGRCGVDSFCCNVGVLEKGCCMHGSPGIATRIQRGLE